MISGNMVGMYSSIGKTIILVDEDGNEVAGLITENAQVFNATPEDVKIGKTFAGEEGILEGTDTKTYRTTHGMQGIPAGKSISIPLSHYDQYDYTKFQCIITSFNSSLINSTAAIKISLNDNIYNVCSTDVVSNISKNAETKSIDLNIVNDTGSIVVINYMTYKEEA